jgi:peroxiredoxin
MTSETSEPVATALAQALRHCSEMDASLGERLQTFAGEVRRLRPEFQNAVDELVERLRGSDAGKNAPGPGDVMPAFLLPDEAGHLVSLEELLSKSPVAITFHRGHWCPYCRINIRALARAQQEIQREGGQIVAIMPERQEFSAELKSESQVPFPILTDMDNGYAMSLNLAIWVGPALERMMADFGRKLPEYQGNDAWMLPIPATFIVGTDGRVAARFVDPDYRKRMAIEDMLAVLRAAP